MLSYESYLLQFHFEAGTSRGVMLDRKTYFIRLTDENGNKGIGEAAPLPNLSIDATPDFENQIARYCDDFNQKFDINSNKNLVNQFVNFLNLENLTNLPSLKFALETAFLDYQYGGTHKIFDNDFSNYKVGLQINGLIWMGKKDFMLKQISEKLAQGYKCLKLKIGAIDFEEELNILASIRKEFSADEITLRVDANGAFSAENAIYKLEKLAAFDLHSIEQPIAAGQHEIMRKLCEVSPIPIALDEELIGVNNFAEKQKMLSLLKPAYIILKPTLVGGFVACDEWIEIAENLGIDWWITSALESNIGLNAICQYTAKKTLGTKYQSFPQGLGTGLLYKNNIDIP